MPFDPGETGRTDNYIYVPLNKPLPEYSSPPPPPPSPPVSWGPLFGAGGSSPTAPAFEPIPPSLYETTSKSASTAPSHVNPSGSASRPYLDSDPPAGYVVAAVVLLCLVLGIVGWIRHGSFLGPPTPAGISKPAEQKQDNRGFNERSHDWRVVNP